MNGLPGMVVDSKGSYSSVGTPRMKGGWDSVPGRDEPGVA